MADDATPLSRRTAGTARRLWGLVFVRAAAYLVAGVIILANPDEGLSWLRVVVGVVILAQGALLTLENLPARNTAQDDVNWRFIAGLISIGAGLLVVLWPSMTAPLMYLVIGVWACAAGVMGIIGGLRGRAIRAMAWDWQLVNAVLWLVLGIVVLARPTDDTLAIALLLALYLLLAGSVLAVGGLATTTRQKDHDAAATRSAARPGPAGAQPDGQAPGPDGPDHTS